MEVDMLIFENKCPYVRNTEGTGIGEHFVIRSYRHAIVQGSDEG